MDVKKESKIILSVLALGPLGVGFVFALDGQLYGWLLILLALIILAWLWKPWKWFQKPEEHHRK